MNKLIIKQVSEDAEFGVNEITIEKDVEGHIGEYTTAIRAFLAAAGFHSDTIDDTVEDMVEI